MKHPHMHSVKMTATFKSKSQLC